MRFSPPRFANTPSASRSSGIATCSQPSPTMICSATIAPATCRTISSSSSSATSPWKKRALRSPRASPPRHARGSAPWLVPAEPLQLAPRAAHRFEDVELTRAALAWPIPGLTDDDAPVLDLLAAILGHGDSSILWQEIREQAGLVHSIDAAAWNPGTSGLFCISFTCDGAKREAATAAIVRTLSRRAAHGFTAPQLKKALRQLVVGEINTRKTMSGQASRLGAAEVVVGDLDYSRAYFERLRAVAPGELKRALKTYLVPARLTAISLNPAVAAGAAPVGVTT